MWSHDACLEPLLWNGDWTSCWVLRGHDGDCETACRDHQTERLGPLSNPDKAP